MNHLDLIGWINTTRYKWAELTGREIKFKPATFYLGVADHLARHVEGCGDVAESSRHPSGDILSARDTRAGAGVTTVEGVEHQGPSTATESPPLEEGLKRGVPSPDNPGSSNL